MKKILLSISLLLMPSLVFGTIAIRGIGALNSTANTSSYTLTATNPPGADSLVLVAVINSKSTTPDVPTLLDQGMTWVEVLTLPYNTIGSELSRITLFRSMTNGLPYTNTITADFGGVNQSGCAIRAINLFGVDTSGTFGSGAIVQVGTNVADATANPNITLSALTGSDNAVIAFFANDRNGLVGTPEAGWTEDWDSGFSNPPNGGYCTYRNLTTDNTIVVTSASSDWAGVAFEINNQTAPPINEWPLIGLEILPGGWEIGATIATSPDGSSAALTNLQFFGGWDYFRDSIRSAQNLELNIIGTGFDSTGNAVNKSRKVWGARLKRLNYPMQKTNVVVAQNVTNVHALVTATDYIYTNETVMATANLGWFATTNISNEILTNAAAFTGFTVTNSSTISHTEPSMNWAWPGMQRWTNSTEYVAVFGGHWSGVAGVRIDAIDENSNTNTSWAVRRMHSFGAGPLRDTWVGAINTSTFSNFNRIRVDFTVFPQYGNAVFSTLSNRWSGLTVLPSAQTNYLDRFNAFTNIAVVSLAGNDTNGDATNGAPESVDPGSYLLSINTAANRLSATNWLTVGIAMPIGTIYVRSGVTNQSGSNLSHSNNPASWTIIKNYPGDVVTLTNRTGDNDLTDCVKFEGITMGFPSGNICLVGCDQIWLDNCTINSETTALWSGANPRIYYTDVHIVRSRHGPASGSYFALMRDVDLSGQNGTVLLNTGLGLTKNSKTNSAFLFQSTHQTENYYPSHIVWKDMEFYGLEQSTSITMGGGTNTHFGAWFENLMFESPTNSSYQMFATANDTNVVIKNSSFIGAREQLFYNSTDAGFHHQARILNSIFWVPGFATDMTEFNAALTNNHPQRYGVGYQGNALLYQTNYANHGYMDWGGLDSYSPGLSTNDNYVRFVDYQAYEGLTHVTIANDGFGDYRLLSDNEILKLNQRNLGGTDLFGQNYGGFQAPGAIGSGNARKGVMFW